MTHQGGSKTSTEEDLVGCAWAFLVIHINDNALGLTVGQEGIDIDHIRPVSSFNLVNNTIEQRECMDFNNLQLMTENKNRHVKGSSYNASEYASNVAGKAIAKLRVGWVIEFPMDESLKE